MTARLEKLFQRYRERGDAAALAEVFDATAPELFRLAQHLVRDALSAEDVLQDTFVAAIDAAPRWDASRPLVPWLTGILARKASESRRRARREVDPTRLDGRGERDPACSAEDAEFSRELRAALAKLPELYREVLERHLLEGVGPAEIARELERSPGAVRMQLFRGLEQLRRALPAGFAAGAALAFLAPRGLASVREVVLAHAVSQGAVLAVAGGAAAASTLAWPLGLATALVLALASAGWFARGVLFDAPRGLEPAAPLPQASGPAPSGPAIEGNAPRVQAPGPAASEAFATAAPRVLRGRVRGPQGQAAEQVALALRGVARYAWSESHTARAHPTAEGDFEIELDGLLAASRERGPLDALELQLDHPDWLPERVLLDARTARVAAADAGEIELWVEVELRPALVLEGSVERGAPGAAPEVGALPVIDGVIEYRWLDRTFADDRGHFRLRLPAVGEVEVVACAPDTLADQERLWVGPGGAQLSRALRLDSGVRVEGRLTLPGLEGLVDAVHLVANFDGPAPPSVKLADRHLTLREGRWRVGGKRGEVGSDGTFTLVGLEALPHRLSPAGGKGVVLYPYSAFERTCELRAPVEVLELEVAAARLRVRLVDGAGVAQAGTFEISVGDWFTGMTTHADGVREFAVPPFSDLKLWSPSGSGGVRELRAPAGGAALEVELPIEGEARLRTLRLDVQAPPGAVQTWTVALSRPGEEQPFDVRTLEAGEGLLELPGPPAEAFDLELFAGGAHQHLQDGWLPIRMAVPQSGVRLDILPFELEPGARLRLVARDAAGRALPLDARIFDLWGVEQSVRFLRRGSADQAFTPAGRLSDLGPVDVVPNLAPGLWTVEVVGEDGVARRRHVRLAVGDEVELEFAP